MEVFFKSLLRPTFYCSISWFTICNVDQDENLVKVGLTDYNKTISRSMSMVAVQNSIVSGLVREPYLYLEDHDKRYFDCQNAKNRTQLVYATIISIIIGHMTHSIST